MTLVVRPARYEDVKHYYPDLGASFRAWVAEIDGELAGIVGLVLTRPIACLISATSEALRPHLRNLAVLRAIKRVHALCEAYGGRIVAVQEPGVSTSPIILKRMGFRPLDVVEGDMVYEYKGA